MPTVAGTISRRSQCTSARQKLRSAATVLPNLGEEDLAATTEKEFLALAKTGTLTAAGTKKLEYDTRKLTQTLK